MMLKFKSRQPKPLFQQQDLIGTSSSSTSNKCPSDSSSSSSSSQPHSPSTPNSPSLGSYSPITSDSPTLKAGFDMISVDSTSRQPKAGILLYTKPPASAGAAVMNVIEDDENECIQQLERPGSNSSLPSLRFSESGGGQQQQSQRNSKHIAYATAFEGSIVRRREITTPSSTDSRQGSPQPSRPTMEKQSSSSSLPNQPQFEYSRIYYSSNNSQKKRKGGLKGILAL